MISPPERHVSSDRLFEIQNTIVVKFVDRCGATQLLDFHGEKFLVKHR